jgi:glycosyltransferase involved in cell wall biosynthesis
MISVIVCTANRGERLEMCFDALSRAGTNGPAGWELIVVDNGSADDTRAVVERRASRRDLPLRYVAERQPGLSRARNAGVAAALQPILAFTDDDCLVAPGWLDAIASAFTDPHLSALGGRVTLHDANDFPLSIRPFSEPADIVNVDDIGRYLIGCNMAARRSVFDAVGLFDVRLGAGTPSGSAEDLDFFYRCLKRGFTLRYSPAPHIYHAHGRRTAAAANELAKGYLAGRGAFYFKHAVRGDPSVMKHLYWEIRGLGSAVRSQNEPRWGWLKCLLLGGFRYILGR